MNKFTDTQNYSIKCNVCYQMFKGNDEAVSHSKSTGHINFVQL
jgi:ubiquitin thioesterase OTU1